MRRMLAVVAIATTLIVATIAVAMGASAEQGGSSSIGEVGAVTGGEVVTSADGSRALLASPESQPIDDLRSRAEAHFGDRFAGVSGTSDSPVVHVVDSGEGVPGEFEGSPVRSAAVSMAQLQDAKSFVDSNWEPIKGRVPNWSSWGIGVAENALIFEVVGDSSDVASEALAHINELVSGVPVEVRVVNEWVKEFSRNSDDPPYSGGVAILGQIGIGNYMSGTSGFMYYSAAHGVLGMTSAGHITGSTFPSNWSQYTRGWFGNMIWNGSLNTGQARVDGAFATGAGYDPWMYTGGQNSNFGFTVGGYYAGTQSGYSGLRTSGAASGEQYRPNGTVLYSDVGIFIGGDPQPTYHLNVMECYGTFGDSGGPVFQIDWNRYMAIVAGTIVGGTTNGTNLCYYNPVWVYQAHLGGAPVALLFPL